MTQRMWRLAAGIVASVLLGACACTPGPGSGTAGSGPAPPPARQQPRPAALPARGAGTKVRPATVADDRRPRRLLRTGQSRRVGVHAHRVPEHHLVRRERRAAAVPLQPQAQPLRHCGAPRHRDTAAGCICLAAGGEVPLRRRNRPERGDHPHHRARRAARRIDRAGPLPATLACPPCPTVWVAWTIPGRRSPYLRSSQRSRQLPAAEGQS